MEILINDYKLFINSVDLNFENEFESFISFVLNEYHKISSNNEEIIKQVKLCTELEQTSKVQKLSEINLKEIKNKITNLEKQLQQLKLDQSNTKKKIQRLKRSCEPTSEDNSIMISKRKAVETYIQITKISWDFQAPKEESKGYIDNKTRVYTKPFKFQKSKMSDEDIYKEHFKLLESAAHSDWSIFED